MLPRFDANVVWDCIADGVTTLFMAVPTVYAKLIAAWENSSPERRAFLSTACGKLRLMVSGSAALPVSTLERWKEISGHTLLERYGMTEIGMALSNPLHGKRVPGSVGLPLPSVEVQLVGENGEPVTAGTPGEIEVRGPSVFAEYWGQPNTTREAFRNGWFRTGDTAIVENGVYRILGRTNIDILKTGGHKVSALEIEETLREHPAVAECAVVGVPDAEWGERVGVAIVLSDGNVLDLPSLRAWAKSFLAAHKVPSRLRRAGRASTQRHGQSNQARGRSAVSNRVTGETADWQINDALRSDQPLAAADHRILGRVVWLDARRHGFGDLCAGAQSRAYGIASEVGYKATPANVGFAGSILFALFLVGWGLSLVWGPLADRFGRTRVLAATIFVYAIFTGAAALSQTVWQLALFRLLAGIGIGGEWALAGTYVAEAWPEDRRKMGAGYLQTGYYAGFFLASALNLHRRQRAMAGAPCSGAD